LAETLTEERAHPPAPPVTRTVIEASEGWRALDLAELWRYRELLYFLVWRDVKVRYKQTALGAAWAILQPLVAMAIFTVFLGLFVRVPSDGLPYPLFVYAGLLLWTYFANALTAASTGLVGNANLISKVYFPRLLVPIASVLAGVIDFAIGFVLLLLLLVFYGYTPGLWLLLTPLFVGFAMVTAVAVGTLLSALNVQYRDVRYAIPFLLQVWMFATPVVYPASVVPERFRGLYGLNPMAGIVESFRWALFGTGQPPGALQVVSLLTVLALLALGLLYFRRTERVFADVV
jgi:lipopolysaccharide transport system permease protein